MRETPSTHTHCAGGLRDWRPLGGWTSLSCTSAEQLMGQAGVKLRGGTQNQPDIQPGPGTPGAVHGSSLHCAGTVAVPWLLKNSQCRSGFGLLRTHLKMHGSKSAFLPDFTAPNSVQIPLTGQPGAHQGGSIGPMPRYKLMTANKTSLAAFTHQHSRTELCQAEEQCFHLLLQSHLESHKFLQPGFM